MTSFALDLHQRISRRPLIRLRIAFALIWLIYDGLDVYWGATHTILLSDVPIPSLLWTQCFLILTELFILVGFKPRFFALIAFLLRAIEFQIFPLNDFLYFCVSALLLSQCDCSSERGSDLKLIPARAWPRNIFVLQLAWIYFSSALLKLNPSFLSGGDLFVRQNYTFAAFNWPYPQFYRIWISSLSGNAVLAWVGVAAEFSLAFTLLAWLKRPQHRSRLRILAVGLALGIHGFSALSLNVFFFGASLLAQVWFLTTD